MSGRPGVRARPEQRAGRRRRATHRLPGGHGDTGRPGRGNYRSRETPGAGACSCILSGRRASLFICGHRAEGHLYCNGSCKPTRAFKYSPSVLSLGAKLGEDEGIRYPHLTRTPSAQRGPKAQGQLLCLRLGQAVLCGAAWRGAAALPNLLALFGGVESEKLILWASWHEYSLESRVTHFQIRLRPCVGAGVRPPPAWQEARARPRAAARAPRPACSSTRTRPAQAGRGSRGRPPKGAL